MKTKISHLGRSTVSVILAVMMLLSTMLIGTVSTVNAATSTKKVFLLNAANWKTPYAYCWDGSNENRKWPGIAMTKEGTLEGSDVYSFTPTTGYSKIIFNDSGNSTTQTATLDYPTTDNQMYNNYTKQWTTYSGGSGGGSTSTDYYIAGRFKTQWDDITTAYKFIESSEQKGLYYYDTDETVASLSGQISEGTNGNFDRYFYIRSSNGKYLTSVDGAGHSFQINKNSQNYLTLVTNDNTPEERLIKFSDPSDQSNDKVTIWLDTTNNDMRLYYTAGSESSLTPVAESVSLTASHETVTSGGSTTLTATLTNKVASEVKLTLTGGDIPQTATVKGSDTTATFTVSPTSTTTYTVTASAENYSSKSAKATVSVTVADTYYLWTSDSDDVTNASAWTSTKLTYSNGSYVGNVVFPKNGSNYFFTINKSSNSVRESSIWSSKNEVKENLSSTETSGFTSAIDVQENNGCFLARVAFQKENTDVKFTFTPEKTVVISRNTSTPVGNVTIKVPTVENAIVTAVANSITYNEGKSFDIKVGSPFTVNVKGENGYTLKKITYGTQSETVTGASFKAVSGEETFNVEMVHTVSNQVTVTFGSNKGEYGTVSAMNGTTSLNSPAKVNVGDTVKFTAAPKPGYTFTGWTVKVNGKSETYSGSSLPLEITANTIVTANFKVEDSGTIAKSMYFLYGSSNNPTSWEGQQGYNNSEYGKYDVYIKDEKYIVTLKKEHYKTLYFAFSTTNEYKQMVPNKDLSVIAENPVDLRLVNVVPQGYNADTEYKFGMMSIISENSEYIGEIKIIYDPNAKTYTVEATKDSASDTTVNIVGKDGTVRKDYYGKTTSALGNTELKVTSPDNTTITAIDSCKMNDNSQGVAQGVTAKKVPYGSEVTVTTTINPDATFAGHKGSEYYVKGFSINGFTGGVLTQQAGNSHEGDVYEYTFTVKKDVYADVSTIEITPIYFLKNDSNCITFYVENFMDAKAKWGDTIACYAYYSSDHALGDYPGQPMVNAEGSIYMQIPKYIGKDTTNVVKGITLNNYVWDFVHVSGDDGVRESKNCQTYDYDDFKYLANMSKVNSSDSLSDIKNIVYRFKYHTYNNTSDDASAAIGNVPKDTLPETTVDNTKYEVFVDYYDKPTDIFGTIINGNDAVTVDTVKKESKYLTIVSDGYVNYYKDTDNYLGQYATKWYIYNEENQKVAALPPSALLYGLTKSSTDLKNLVTQGSVPQDFMSDSGASKDLISDYWDSFKLLYNQYAGKYAIINYESAIHSKGRDGAKPQMGERCDGRWYYSVDKAKITGDIRIEYADTLDSFTTMTGVNTDTFDVDTATGKNTAAEAYFTSPAGQSTTGKPIHVETTSDNSENFMFTVGATSSTTKGYTFVGWYRLIDDTYKAVNDPSELNKTTGQVARNANVVLVARYIKTPGGSMTFQHSLYRGENAGGGKATTEIQVVVKSSGGKEYYNSGIIDSTASIDKKTISEILTDQQGAKITVTLYTTTKNLYDFKGYYSAENTPVTKSFTPDSTPVVTGNRKKGLVTTSEYTFSFNEYYQKYAKILTAADAGTVYYNFYSDITSIKVPYKVQFSYTDRKGDQKYYNKAGYVDPENTSSYTFDEIDNDDVKVTLTESFILTLAPYESNFTKNLTWDRNSIRTTAFDSSKSESSIASAVVNSEQSEKKIHLSVFRDKGTHKPTSRDNLNGAFEFYEKDGSTELPYGSVFYTSNGDGTYEYDITAEKTYTDEDGTHQFMYWAIYSDSNCEEKDLVIKAYNSEGHFSYVAYDNCWIVPVYEESSTPSASVKKVYTTTQFMEVTRNQWTANNADSFTTGFDVDAMTKLDDFNKEYGEDKLYADFVLNFFYNGKQLSTFDPDSLKVQAGVLIQRLDLDKNDTTGYITDLNHYANKYNEADLEQAKNDAIKKITTGTSDIKSVKQQINNSRLDNKNRLQYYTRFNNVVDNSNYVFRLYTYIQYTDANGKQVVELSDPVYFTFYDIANK